MAKARTSYWSIPIVPGIISRYVEEWIDQARFVYGAVGSRLLE